MSDETEKKPVESMLIKPLEAYYVKHYPAAQRAEIAKSFGMLTTEHLVALYEKTIRSSARQPMLSDLLKIYEQKETHAAADAGGGNQYARGQMPWEDREREARKEAVAYARNAMESDSVWRAAQEEGWGYHARTFIEAWAYCQALAIKGATNYGVDADTMLGCSAGGDDYDRHLAEMREAIQQAVATKTIDVPAPVWFVTYGRRMARNRAESFMRTPLSTRQAVADTAQALTA